MKDIYIEQGTKHTKYFIFNPERMFLILFILIIITLFANDLLKSLFSQTQYQ